MLNDFNGHGKENIIYNWGAIFHCHSWVLLRAKISVRFSQLPQEFSRREKKIYETSGFQDRELYPS